MSLNDTPSSERVHIGFFGRRNAGKSSVVNAVTGQDLAVVSDKKGTTTDPVQKAMEILPLGPVVVIDTPGFDDEGQLGELRVERTRKVLGKTDIAVLVVDGTVGITGVEKELIGLFDEKKIPYITVYNKTDLLNGEKTYGEANEIYVSALSGEGINELKERIARLKPDESAGKTIVGDLLVPGDITVLVTPIDESAPKGRMILPQQQVIRDVLDADSINVVVKEFQLEEALKSLAVKPKIVITDSQVFEYVSKIVPEDIPLTSFSILMARYKGFLKTAVKGAAAIKNLKDGDRILVSEGCTHHRQCKDIGTVKLPAWIKKFTGKEVSFDASSGTGYPSDIEKYALVLHCGACMLNPREVQSRMEITTKMGVPFTNYGIAIAYMNGILKRAVAMFPDIAQLI